MSVDGSHLFHLGEITPQKITAGGSRVAATRTNFPKLRGMSFYKLLLNPYGIREPHWHANADELGYCLKGKVLVSLYANRNVKSSFVVEEGEAFLIPSGTLHSILNCDDETSAELIFMFSNEEPEDFSLSSSFNMFTNNVLGNTWHVEGNLFNNIKRNPEAVFITLANDDIALPEQAYYASPYRHRLSKTPLMTSSLGGTVQVARQDVWPILRHQALYNLKLTGKGMREPHWHPETAELGYVEEGKGRMSIQSPDGSVETYEMNPGDIYFIPKAYPHHIENLTDGLLHLLIFFDLPLPQDIGFSASIKSFPSRMLEATLPSPMDFFDQLPTYYADLLVVEKINPVDK